MPWMGIRRDKSGIRYVYGYGGDKIKEVFSNAFSFLYGNAKYNHNEKLFPFIRLAESKEMSHMLQW